MNFLVLGSSGQIGSSLVGYLKRRGHSVLAPDCDLAVDNGSLLPVMKACDFVFFLAFRAGGARFLKDKQNDYQFVAENVRIIQNVFEQLRATGVPFVYTSSQMSNMNHSSYGTIKRLAEFYTQSLGGLFVKFWNVYGVETAPAKFHAVSDFCVMAKRDRQIKMRTTGQEWRQFLYSEDCCEALLTIAQNYKQLQGKSLHVTSFEWVRIIELAQIIADINGGVDVKPATAADLVQLDARNEPDPFILDFWKPKTSLRSGLKKIMKGLP